MATLNVILEGRSRDRGLKKYLRDSAKLAEDLAVNVDRAASAGRRLSNVQYESPRGRGRGATQAGGPAGAAAPGARQPRAGRTSSDRAAKEFDRALEQSVKAARAQGKALDRQAKAQERAAKHIDNLSKEQLVAVELTRETNRRRRAEARSIAQKQLGPDPNARPSSGRGGGGSRRGAFGQAVDVGSKIAIVGNEFDQFGARAEQGIRASYDAFADYEHKLTEISTITDDVSLKQIDAITKGAVAEFGGEPLKQAEALQKVMSLGATSASDAQAQLMAANKLGIAGSANVADSVMAISKAVSNFKGVDAQEAADAMFAVTQASSAEVGDLAQALPRVAAGASIAGLTLQETVGTIGQLSNKLPDANQAVTGMIQMLSNIQKPTKRAREEARRIGIDFSVAGIEAAGGWEEFLLKLRSAEKFDENTLAKLFDSSEARIAVAAITEDMEGLRKNLEAQEGAAGGTEKAYAKMTDTAAHKAAKLEGQWELLKIQAGEALIPALTELSKELGPIIKDISEWMKYNPGLIRDLGGLAIKLAIAGKAAGVLSSALSMGAGIFGAGKAITEFGVDAEVAGGKAEKSARKMSKMGQAARGLKAGMLIATGAIAVFQAALDQASESIDREQARLDKLHADLNEIKFKDEKGQDIAESDLMMKRRQRLVDDVNAKRQQAYAASGQRAGTQMRNGNIIEGYKTGIGGVVNNLTGVTEDAERQALQAELDLQRFDEEYGGRLNIDEQDRFRASASLFTEADSLGELTQLLREQLVETKAIAANTSQQQGLGPSMEAGLT